MPTDQRRHAVALALGAVLILLASLLDRQLIAPFYDPALREFPLRRSWGFEALGHTALKWLMLGFWSFCLAWGGPLRRGALYMALIAAVVAALKHYSPVSCPWDLPEYGGAKPDAGRCLPAAHPITGFALFGLVLALSEQPRAARYALAAALLVGVVAGAVQVVRGAHFPSHVLWTGWIAWAVTLALAGLGRHGARRV
jgi:membrane-associated PAP2 superfamily phosphatase